MDDVVLHLLDEQAGDGAGGARGAAPRKRARRAAAGGHDKRVPQVLSYELLAQEPAALKWFTGLKADTLDWTIRALRLAVVLFGACAFCLLRAVHAVLSARCVFVG